MRRWFIGSNNFYFTSGIYLEDGPWYVYAIETSISWICSYFPRIPLPKIKIIRDKEETNLKEYYGDTRDLFHIFVCDPITNWCFKKIDMIHFDHPYEMLKKEFPKEFENPDELYEDDDEEDKLEREDNLKYSKLVGEEFKLTYNKLQKIADVRMKKIYDKDKEIKT
jgi:hypothetical protein